MHVHANYSQTLATLGAGRDEAQEMAARRAAEVRRRLAVADQLLKENEEDVAFVKASTSIDPGPDPQGDAYSATDGEQQQPAATNVAPEREHGSLFSARA